jgi:hypothetical protein
MLNLNASFCPWILFSASHAYHINSTGARTTKFDLTLDIDVVGLAVDVDANPDSDSDIHMASAI